MDNRDENEIDETLDAQESLFIVEGLAEPASEEPAEPQIVEMMVPAPVLEPEEETPASAALDPLSVNLAQAEATTLVNDLAQEFAGSEEAAGFEEAQAPAEGEEELVSEGVPALYKWGSIAAALLLLVVGGGIYWKKQSNRDAELALAAAPKKPLRKVEPAPVDAPANVEETALVAAKPPAVVPESEPVSIAPAPVEEAPVNVIEPAVVETAPAPPVLATTVEPVPAPSTTAEPVRPLADPLDEEPAPRIRRGEGILQLKNGNLFPGRVMKVSPKGVVLRVAEGDLVFPLDDVVQVLPAGSKDYEGYPHGFVELANGNRLWGRILDRGESTVTVAVGLAKVVIQREQITAVKLGLGVGVIIP